MKCKLKGRLRNFIYQHAEWLFLIIYGDNCRRNLLIYVIGIAFVIILELCSITPNYTTIKIGTVVELVVIWILVHTRNYKTIQRWLEENPSQIDLKG